MKNCTLKIGDTAVWTSQSHGTTKTKTGVVVAVIAKGQKPEHHGSFKGLVSEYSLSRDHETYVFQVGNKHYWPRVSAIQLCVYA